MGKKDRIKNVKKEFENFVNLTEKKMSGEITVDSKLDEVAQAYFDNERTKSDWTDELKRGYDLYIQEPLGGFSIGKVTLNRINTLKRAMETQGLTKQTKNGCKPRTINKIIVQTLLPILKYAIDNGADITLPNFKKLKVEEGQKIVKDAPGKFKMLFNAIMIRYADIPYYRAMFLLALYGRRWNEIRTLEKQDIDYLANTYTVRAENSKTKKEITYNLPGVIAAAIMELNPDTDLIFANPSTGKKPWTPKKQLQHLKDDTGIDALTMHYFRHIVSSTLTSLGGDMTAAMAALGHSSSKTTETHYITLDQKKNSNKANSLLEDITKTD